MKFYKQLEDGTILITAPVMIPETPDCDYENGEKLLTKKEIKEFAKSYETYQFIDQNHEITRNGHRIGVPRDSFLLNEDTTAELWNGSKKIYPAGTWFITSNITDPKAIETAKKGGFTGYSPSVLNKERADKYLEAFKADKSTPYPVAYKSVNSMGNSLIKDVKNPVVFSVSLVQKPCLHESKFCKLERDKMTEDVKSIKTKVLNAIGMSEEAEVEALKSEVTDLKDTITQMQTEFSETLKNMHLEFTKAFEEMQKEFTTTLENALKPVKPEEEEEKAEEKVEEETTTEEKPPKEKEEEEEEAEEKEKKRIANKGHSKTQPIHDNLTAEKSQTMNIYEALGRNPDGTRKRL